MMDDPKGVLWTEKYRPRSLNDMALEEETRAVLQSYLDDGEIPHLLLSGPAGSGKTTVARIIMRTLDCQTLSLNASSDRGIDIVRERIGGFITAAFGARWNVVFLDEADAMTSDAQTAMRNQIEAYADRSRFILTCNYPHKIISPIQSRCQHLVLGRPPLKERYRILAHVLNTEGVTFTPQDALGYAERFPDLREMLMAAQRALRGAKTNELPTAHSSARGSGADALGMIEARDWTGIRRLVTSGDFDVRQGLSELFYAIPDNHPHCSYLRHVIAKAHHESTFTPDPNILFLGACAECIEGIQ